MTIRTKIVATVGPACSEAEVLAEMATAGVDVFRINFSHGDPEQRGAALENIRRIEQVLDVPLAVMADLCGPKIRVGPIQGGSCLLAAGSRISVRREALLGGPEAISTTLAELVDHVQVGQSLGLDEGRMRLRVVEAGSADEFVCEVAAGGVLASGKGVHLGEMELALPALTEKDRGDVAWICERDFDYVALSFVQRGQDVADLRALLDEDVRIVAKIEKPQALARIEEIMDASDAIMVARGDLGAEMSLPQVPLVQKELVRLAREKGKCCIVATQMLETMTHGPQPTRAEAADIANAVLDGTDAVMLSGETAVGEHPVRVVAVMNEIAAAAEAYEAEHPSPVRVEYAPAPALAGSRRPR